MTAAGTLWLCLAMKFWRFYQEFWLCDFNVLISAIEMIKE